MSSAMVKELSYFHNLSALGEDKSRRDERPIRRK